VARKCVDTHVLQCEAACKRDYDLSTPIEKYWRRSGGYNDPDPTIHPEPEPTIHFPFETPYVRVRMQSFFSSQAVQRMNSHLYDLVMLQYANILRSNPDFAKLPPKTRNDQFFKWQKWQNRRRRSPCHDCEPGWTYLAEDSEFAKLDAVIQNVTDSFLTYLKLGHLVKTRHRTIQEAWASVHHEGIGHRGHTHPECMLSGVYYLRVPSDAGNFVFQDPRGGGFLPPFESYVEIRPQEGDLIIFPAWFAHEVEETKGHDVRVSLAFNLPGKWKDVANIRESVKLPIMKK